MLRALYAVLLILTTLPAFGSCEKDEANTIPMIRLSAKQTDKADGLRKGDVKKSPEKEKNSWRHAAKDRDAYAQFMLGIAHFTGDDVTAKNDEKAFKWVNRSASQGFPDAQGMLGLWYSEGYCGLKKNPKRAFELWGYAANQGNARSQFLLGRAYLLGIGVGMDFEKAIEWLRQAAKNGNAQARSILAALSPSQSVHGSFEEQESAVADFNLGNAYSKGKGVEKDFEKAVECWGRAAKKRNANAQLKLGFAYANGAGVELNIHEAFNWWRLAAEQGNSKAQYTFGFYGYHISEIIKHSNHYQKIAEQLRMEAFKWLERATEQGDPAAKLMLKIYEGDGTEELKLGNAYSTGEGGKKNPEEALNCWKRAAKKRNVAAQLQLGMAYDTGNGVAADPKKAFKWWERAAKQGSSEGKVLLSRVYLAGKGVEVNEKLGYELLHQAAQQRHPEAQFLLGYKLYKEYKRFKNDNDKESVKRIYIEAERWLRKASEQGHAGAKLKLERLLSHKIDM